MPATTSSTSLIDSMGGHQCVCAWVCGMMRHHHVHIGALKKKFATEDQKETTLFTAHPITHTHKHTHTHTHTHSAVRTTYSKEQQNPSAPLYLTHANPPAHMWFISTMFKAQRTGNHYDSVPLTPTLRDEILRVCLTLLPYFSSDPKKTLKICRWQIRTTSIKGWEKSLSCLLYSMCGPFCINSGWSSSCLYGNTTRNKLL